MAEHWIDESHFQQSYYYPTGYEHTFPSMNPDPTGYHHTFTALHAPPPHLQQNDFNWKPLLVVTCVILILGFLLGGIILLLASSSGGSLDDEDGTTDFFPSLSSLRPGDRDSLGNISSTPLPVEGKWRTDTSTEDVGETVESTSTPQPTTPKLTTTSMLPSSKATETSTTETPTTTTDESPSTSDEEPPSTQSGPCLQVGLPNVLGIGKCLGPYVDFCRAAKTGFPPALVLVNCTVTSLYKHLSPDNFVVTVKELLFALAKQVRPEVVTLLEAALGQRKLSKDAIIANYLCEGEIKITIPISLGKCLNNIALSCEAGKPIYMSLLESLGRVVSCFVQDLIGVSPKDAVKDAVKNLFCDLIKLVTNKLHGFVKRVVNAFCGFGTPFGLDFWNFGS